MRVKTIPPARSTAADDPRLHKIVDEIPVSGNVETGGRVMRSDVAQNSPAAAVNVSLTLVVAPVAGSTVYNTE
jgi:hypothetical protein